MAGTHRGAGLLRVANLLDKGTRPAVRHHHKRPWQVNLGVRRAAIMIVIRIIVELGHYAPTKLWDAKEGLRGRDFRRLAQTRHHTETVVRKSVLCHKAEAKPGKRLFHCVGSKERPRL